MRKKFHARLELDIYHDSAIHFLDVVGFYFLDLATDFTPPDDLVAFLAAGEPPVYIGYQPVHN